MKRCFEMTATRPATIAAFEKGTAINGSSAPMAEEAKKTLFGKTAATR